MNTFSIFLRPSTILLQPHGGRFLASDFDFLMTVRQCLAIKRHLRDVGLLLECLFGIVWVYNMLMNTPSRFLGPSVILLQPHGGRFLASDSDFYWLSGNVGHQVMLFHLADAHFMVDIDYCITNKDVTSWLLEMLNRVYPCTIVILRSEWLSISSPEESSHVYTFPKEINEQKSEG